MVSSFCNRLFPNPEGEGYATCSATRINPENCIFRNYILPIVKGQFIPRAGILILGDDWVTRERYQDQEEYCLAEGIAYKADRN